MARWLTLLGLVTAAGCGTGAPISGLYAGFVHEDKEAGAECILEVFSTGPDRAHVTLDCADGLQDGDGASVEWDGALVPDGGGLLTLEAGWIGGTLHSASGRTYLVEGKWQEFELRTENEER